MKKKHKRGMEKARKADRETKMVEQGCVCDRGCVKGMCDGHSEMHEMLLILLFLQTGCEVSN